MLEIKRGDMSLGLLPSLGGSVAYLRWRGSDLLRPAPGGARSPLECACFPLLPFANRIANAKFQFDGSPVELPRHGTEPHALHGQGWLAPWQVVSAGKATTGEGEISLAFDHPGHDEQSTGWPWRYSARQTFALLPDGCAFSLSITNHDSKDMPAGLGFHPYFYSAPGCSLHAAAIGAWLRDRNGLAVDWRLGHLAAELAGGLSVEDHYGFDDCFGGWNGSAEIRGGSVPVLRITASGTPCLHAYLPRGENYFCVEPVSHAPDAVNRDGPAPMKRLSPGATVSIQMVIRAGSC